MSQNVLLVKIFGGQTIGRSIFLGLKIFWGQHFLRVKIIEGQHFNGAKIFEGQNFQGSTFLKLFKMCWE